MTPEFLQVLPYKDNGIAADWLEENSETPFAAIAIRQNLYHLDFMKCGDYGSGWGGGTCYGDCDDNIGGGYGCGNNIFFDYNSGLGDGRGDGSGAGSRNNNYYGYNDDPRIPPSFAL